MAEVFVDLLVKIVLIATAPVVAAFFARLRSQTESKQQQTESLKQGIMKSNELRKVTCEIVAAVEEQFRTYDGDEKRTEASRLIAEYAQTHGLNLSETVIRTLLDAAVSGLRKAGIKEKVDEEGF